MSMTLLGLLAGFCFAYCGVPAAYLTVKAGRSIGTPIWTACMIVSGGVLMYTYLTVLHGFDWVLAVNYTVEVGSWAVIVKYHYMPSRRPSQ